LGRAVTWTEAAQAWMSAFEREFGISFVPGELTSEELETTRELIATKYANPEWQHRR
jgi:lipoate-protein ligase A